MPPPPDARAADGVDLVDEDDARRVLLRLAEEVTHARGTHADEHLDELGARGRDEGHARLARDRARVRSVLPVPGGPSMMAPLGILAPSAEYLAGSLRKSTISVSSSLEPSQPATSAKVTPVCGSIWILDLDWPTPPGPPIGPPPMPPGPPRDARMLSPMSKNSGRKLIKRPPKPESSCTAGLASGGGTTANCTLCLRSSVTSSASPPGKTLTWWSRPSWSNATTLVPSSLKATLATSSDCTFEISVL